MSSSVLDSGVVDRVEMDCAEPKELMLPHVLEELEEGRRVEGKGFDFERGFVGEDGTVVVRVSKGVSGAVFVGDPRVAVRLEGDEGGWLDFEGDGGDWFDGKSSCLYAAFWELTGVVSSIR